MRAWRIADAKHVLSAVVAATCATAAASPCNVAPQALLGAWQAVGEWAFFEQMSFESHGAERAFDSWLHERPEVSGATWDLVDCILTIREKSGSEQTLRVSLARGQLTLSRPDGTIASRYRRVDEKR